jgi:hypothetical protein
MGSRYAKIARLLELGTEGVGERLTVESEL